MGGSGACRQNLTKLLLLSPSARLFLEAPERGLRAPRRSPTSELKTGDFRSPAIRSERSTWQCPDLQRGPRPGPCPGHPLGARQERSHAGRSPGSRVVARCTAFPGLAGLSVRPSGCPPRLRGPAMCIALTAYSCRDSPGIGRRTALTVFPLRPLSGHRRDLRPFRR